MTEKAEKKDELQKIKEELANKDEQLKDYTDHLKRLQAEFENYCKRIEKEKTTIIQTASERLIVKLLLIFDDFERALKDIEKLPEETRKGIQMIFKNLHKILDEERVEPIKSVGQKFDPYKHEVVLKIESNAPEDTVLEEIQKGYTMNGKIIRYSKVTISKCKEAKKNG